MQISPPQFAYLRAFLKRVSGVSLDESKQYLVEARLRPVARQRGLADIDALVAALRNTSDARLVDEVVCAMMTHETSFFRDKAPFETLARLIPDLLASRGVMKQLVIWSAACSTGQEPYSLAMLLHERFSSLLSSWRVRIIASDLSQIALGLARDGIYSELETARGLSPAMKTKYFRPPPGPLECGAELPFAHRVSSAQPHPALADDASLRLHSAAKRAALLRCAHTHGRLGEDATHAATRRRPVSRWGRNNARYGYRV